MVFNQKMKMGLYFALICAFGRVIAQPQPRIVVADDQSNLPISLVLLPHTATLDQVRTQLGHDPHPSTYLTTGSFQFVVDGAPLPIHLESSLVAQEVFVNQAEQPATLLTRSNLVVSPTVHEPTHTPQRTLSHFAPSAEQELRSHLLADYDINSLPNSRQTGPGVDVQIQVALYKLHELDTKGAQLDINVWMRMQWVDDRLRWDPGQWGGVNQTQFFAMHSAEESEIWVPDIELYNNAHGIWHSLSPARASVSSDGTVFLSMPGALKVLCTFEGLHNFPYDDLVCTMTFGAWVHSSKYLGIGPLGGSGIIMLPSLMETKFQEYSFKKVSETWSSVEYETYEDERWPTGTFRMELVRARSYYTSVVILPLTILSAASFLPFWLSPACGERLGFGITLILAMISTQFLLSALLPVCSERLWINSFISFLFYVAIISIIESTIVIFFYYKHGTNFVPYWVVKVRHRITRVGLCAARHEKTKRTSSKQKQSTNANSGEETEALGELASFVNKHRDYFGDLLKKIEPLQGDQDIVDFVDRTFTILDPSGGGYIDRQQIEQFTSRDQGISAWIRSNEKAHKKLLKEAGVASMDLLSRETQLQKLILALFKDMDNHPDQLITREEFFCYCFGRLKQTTQELNNSEAQGCTSDIVLQLVLQYCCENGRMQWEKFDLYWREVARQIDSVSRTFIPTFWLIGLIAIRAQLGWQLFFEFGDVSVLPISN